MKKSILPLAALILAHGLAALPLPATAATTVLSDKPLASGTSGDVKPNVMFVLDDSGSMKAELMPDKLEDWPNAVGRRSPQCNAVYYNPLIRYDLPVDATGSPFPSRSFTAACTDGFAAAPGCSINLSSQFRAAKDWQANNADASNMAAYYYIYTGSQLKDNRLDPESSACQTRVDSSRTLDQTPNIYPDSIPSSGTGGGTWTKVIVSATSGPGNTDERTNFANWYSYYRTRLMMMKASVGHAFVGIGDKYRIGFVTIAPMSGSAISSSKFLKVAPFDATQKQNWFAKLYATATQTTGTPLREALSRVGRYYAGKNSGINAGMIPTTADDPMQYSCQQNFTILTTDGYWNGNGGVDLNGSSLDNSSFDSDYSTKDAYNPEGEKFYTSLQPMYDGASQVRTTVDVSNAYRLASCSIKRDRFRRVQWQEAAATYTRTTTQLQTRTGQWQQRTLGVQSSSDSGKTWTNVSSCTVKTGKTPTQCRYASTWSAWSNAGSSCTEVAQQTGSSNNTVNNPAVECQVVWGGTNWSNASSCIPSATRECQTITVSTEPGLASCAPSSSNGKTVTCTQVAGPWTNTTGACIASATKLCQALVLQDWTTIASCTPAGPDASGQETQCQSGTGTDPGQRVEYQTTTYTTKQSVSGGVAVGTATTTTSGPTAWAAMTTGGLDVCKPLADGAPVLPTPNPRRPVSPEPPLPTAPCTAWPCETFGAASGGSKGSLADVAQYYYVTDLRTAGAKGALGLDVSANNVPKADVDDIEADKANWQHMTTFTMGLGLSGTLNYDKNYKNGAGDFAAIRQGTLNWPVPTANASTALDDLWHAAVNGRGQYFSASSPTAVSQGLASALSGINNRVASAAAAATSNLEPVAGDNFAYTAKYVTNRWTGDLEAKEIDLTNGKISATALWSAATQLNTQTRAGCDMRSIKLFRAGATDNLVDFKWNTLACDAAGNPTGTAVTTLNATEQANFTAATIALRGQFNQFAEMTDGSGGTVDQRSQAFGAPLVNFLRGQRGNEDFAPDSTAYYRKRDGVLGDVVNAQPVFVKAPFARYNDDGYKEFKAAKANRAPMVYVGANDGMLHAFDANTGKEAWAFIPSAVLPNLYWLADRDYSLNHRYYVDGTPVAGDVFDGTQWRSILVGGLNKGGKIYYALDVTDPANPKALWEFSNANLGYSYGNPLIGKLKDGTWAVFLTSGVNNADGRGHLYVVNAVTGALIRDIDTGAGTPGTPSNLMKIAGWSAADPILDNTVSHIYGADLRGNVWRFDVNDSIAPAGYEATLLMTTKDDANVEQPISTKPELALVGTDIFVYVATGQYLGDPDLATTGVQSVYGIKDPMTEPATPGGMVVAHGRADLQKQTLTQEGDAGSLSAVRKVKSCAVAPVGWYVDLPDTAERVNVDMKLQLGSLIVASNVPLPDACRVGGYSWLNYFSTNNGCSINTENQKVGERLSDSLAVGINVVRLPNNKTVVIATTSDAAQTTLTPPFSIGDPEGRRLTWREITPP